MNRQLGHLSDGQIQECANTSPGGGAQEIEAHLSECEFCLDRLLQWQRTHLKNLESKGMRTEPYAECPPESVLQEVAAEMAAPETATHILQHAAQCDHCGPLLTRYLQEFSEELSPEIEEMIQQLPISQPKWQRKKAREIVRNSPKQEERVSFWKRVGDWWAAVGFVPRNAVSSSLWLKAVAALVVAAGLSVALLFRLFGGSSDPDLAKVQKLIALASGQHRTLEMRQTSYLHGEYIPPDVVMGPKGNKSNFDSPALDKAHSEVSDKQAGGSLSAQWLQAKGRIILLEDPNNAEEAENIFEEARRKGLNDLSLEIDLAVSYFERESKTDNPNLSKTIDQLRKVLEHNNPKPNREEKAVALFDLALAYEKTKARDIAISTWQEYLAIDPSGPWADEARKHLAEIQTRIPKQQSYKDPADFIQHSSDPEVQNDVEQYQEFALGQWLPKAIGHPLSDSGMAVRKVARLLEQRHSDTMWMDLVNSTGEADLPAVQALSAAFVASQNDQHHEAAIKSREAARIFAQHRNTPGELLAHFQEIYALQRGLDGDHCLKRADQLWSRVVTTRYRWLQGQLALERATCANLVFKFQTAETNVDASRALASEANFDFPELRLRITGLEAGMKRLNFQYDAAWIEAVKGLDDYWKHTYSAERLYQFYSVMRSSATETSSFYTAEAFLRRSIEILQGLAPEDNILKALLYMRLANLLSEQDQDSLAEAEADHARALLGTISPREPTAQTYAAVARIELADFELRRHKTELALSAIQPIGEVIATQDKFVKLDFYRVRGDAKLQSNQVDDAFADYQQGIRVAESSLLHMRDDDATRFRWIAAADKIYRGVVQVFLAKQQSKEALGIWEMSNGRFLNRGARDVQLLATSQQSYGKIHLPPVVHPHVVYASFADRLQVWIVQGALSQSASIPLTQTELLRMVREFNQNCNDPASLRSDVDRQGTELYELLLKPVIAALATSETVAIEFDELIPYFAIEALRSPEGRYFGADYAVFRSPGIFAEGALRQPVPLGPQDPFLVVDASPANGPGFLPGHQLPTEAITRIYPQRRVFTGADLSLQKVKQTLRNTVALQFIGHGRRGGKGMALELGPDLFLRSRDFSPELLRRLRLAVLAACSSGSSLNGLFDADSLVRSLLAGGVPNVIASHWNVDSQNTGELFASFYLNLSKGETAAQALRDARKQLLSAKPDPLSSKLDRSHPYYWAGFNLTGRSN